MALKKQKNHLILSISDDGTGLPKAIPQNKGMGLRIMQYRANMIEAEFKIKKNGKQGIKVVCIYKNMGKDTVKKSK